MLKAFVLSSACAECRLDQLTIFAQSRDPRQVPITRLNRHSGEKKEEEGKKVREEGIGEEGRGEGRLSRGDEMEGEMRGKRKYWR